MKRRAFLGLLSAAPVALMVPELLLPTRKFFLPPTRGWFGDDTVYLQNLMNRGLPIPPNERYLISDTLILTRDNYYIHRLHLVIDDALGQKCYFEGRNVKNCRIEEVFVEDNRSMMLADINGLVFT